MQRRAPIIRAVVGIICKAQSILVCKRPKHKSYAGYWEFPGGKIEPEETAEEALIRELYEEIGIAVTQCKFLFVHEHDYHDKSVNLSIWQVIDFNGEPIPRENQVLRWCQLEELKQLKVLEGNWEIIRRLS